MVPFAPRTFLQELSNIDPNQASFSSKMEDSHTPSRESVSFSFKAPLRPAKLSPESLRKEGSLDSIAAADATRQKMWMALVILTMCLTDLLWTFCGFYSLWFLVVAVPMIKQSSLHIRVFGTLVLLCSVTFVGVGTLVQVEVIPLCRPMALPLMLLMRGSSIVVPIALLLMQLLVAAALQRNLVQPFASANELKPHSPDGRSHRSVSYQCDGSVTPRTPLARKRRQPGKVVACVSALRRGKGRDGRGTAG